MRNEHLAALACAVAMLTPCAASSAGKEASPAPAGSECSGTWLEESDGLVRIKFAGTLVGRHPDGSVRPVRDAVFEELRDAQRKRLDFSTDGAGMFSSELRLWSYESRHCKNGEIEVGVVTNKKVIAIAAPHCREARLTLDHKWKPHIIELECDDQRE